MKRKQAYILLEGRGPKHLAELVSKSMDQGYDPHGTPLQVKATNRHGPVESTLCQAMIFNPNLMAAITEWDEDTQ